VVPSGEVEERAKWGGDGDVKITRREEEEGRTGDEESSVMASWRRDDFRMILRVRVGERGMSGRGAGV